MLFFQLWPILKTIPILDLTLVSLMKLTRSLFCLSVLAVLSLSSCTSADGGSWCRRGTPWPLSTSTNSRSGDASQILSVGNRPIHAHRIGLVSPNAADSYGGYGGGFNSGYAIYPMPTERYGDYFNPENDLSLVGHGWDRYTTVFTNTSRPAASQPAPQAAPMTNSK